MPKNGQNQELIPVIEGHQVLGQYDWTGFCNAMKDAGWQDPENNNYVRAAFNLCENEVVEGTLGELVSGYTKKQMTVGAGEGEAQAHEESLANAVRDFFILKAKNDKQFTVDESKRGAILFFQGELNARGGEKFDFNAYYPVKEVNGPVVNQEAVEQPGGGDVQQHNEEPKQEENHQEVNKEEQQEVLEEPEPEAEPRKPEVYSADVLKTQRNLAESMLDEATLKLRGSAEYKNTREEFKRTQQKWKTLMEAENADELSEKDLMALRDDLKNVHALAENYIDKKDRQKDMSENARNRVEAVDYAADVMRRQIGLINDRLDKIREDATPAPETETIANNSRNALQAMDDAKLNLRGSDEYKRAHEAFADANKKLDQFKAKYEGKEKDMTLPEIQEMQQAFREAESAIRDYIGKKSGDTVDENARKRVEAMQSGRAVISDALKKMNELEQARINDIEERNDMTLDSQRAFHAIDDAEAGVRNGSSEYKKAKDSFEKLKDRIAFLNEGEEEATRYDIEEVKELIASTGKDIDKYLDTKKGKDLSDKTQRRVDAMYNAKEVVAMAASFIEQREKSIKNELLQQEGSNSELREEEERVAQGLEHAQRSVGGSKVYNGGADYDKALNMYRGVIVNEAKLDDQRQNGVAIGENALKAEIEQLTAAKDATLTYIHRKEKEKLQKKNNKLDAKGEKRLEQMKKAYDCIRKRLDIAEGKLEEMTYKSPEQKAEERKKAIDEARADIDDWPKLSDDPSRKRGLKVAAIKAAECKETLAELSQKKTLSDADRELMKKAMTGILVAKMIKDGDVKLFSPTGHSFDGAVGQIIKMPECKKAIPDEMLTPEGSHSVLSDEKFVEDSAKKLTTGMKKDIRAKQEKERQKEIQKQKDLEQKKKKMKRADRLKMDRASQGVNK